MKLYAMPAALLGAPASRRLFVLKGRKGRWASPEQAGCLRSQRGALGVPGASPQRAPALVLVEAAAEGEEEVA